MLGNEDRIRQPGPLEGPASPTLDVEHFEQLRRDFAPEAFRGLVELYLGQVGSLVQEIDQALAERDGERAGRAAHKLGGGSAGLGARALADLCATLERQAGDGDLAAAAGTSTRLEATATATARALEPTLSKVHACSC